MLRNKFQGGSLVKRKSVFDSIDSNKIGEGKYFREGGFGNKKI